jgi:radical SAM superfamily enzyme YgiQ (UPF0313 family)
MRVLLIQPPIRDFFFTPLRKTPLGILYLGTVLEKEGFCVKILNTLEEDKRYTLKIPKRFIYLKRYYKKNKSPFSLFNHYYHFGLQFEEMEKEITKFSPQIVGISANFSCYFDSVLEVAEIIKKIDKRIYIVIGGRFATVSPQLVLENECIDFVIRGEAEFSLLKLCKSLKRGRFL